MSSHHSHTSLIAYVFIAMVLASGYFVSSTYAETPSAEQIRKEIESRSSTIGSLEADIKKYQEKVGVLGTQKKSLQNEIQTLDVTRSKLSKDIQLTDSKLSRTSLTINRLTEEISDKEKKIATEQKSITQLIRMLDANESDSMLEIMLSRGSFSDFFTDLSDMKRVQDSLTERLHEVKNLRAGLADERDQHKQEKQKLAELSDLIADQKILADKNRKEQAQLLSVTKNQESNFKKLLAEKTAKKKQVEKEIQQYEEKLRATIDPNSIPQSGTKALAYPLDNIRVTQRFGKTVDAQRLYSSGTHNGIDFAAAMGTTVKSAASGVVIGTGNTDETCRWASYGNWILIKHNNGLATLYGHLSMIKVSQGQSVSTGSIIGYSGNTGYSTGPHLHFTVFAASAVKVTTMPSVSCTGALYTLPVAAKNAYLDPESFL